MSRANGTYVENTGSYLYKAGKITSYILTSSAKIFDESESLKTQYDEVRLFDGGHPAGEYNSSTIFEYDLRGNLVLRIMERDEGADGTIDSRQIERWVHDYDGNGNKTGELYENDRNGDGRVDYRRVEGWTYDGNGNLTSRLYEEDKNGDDRADYRRIEGWTYDGNGKLITQSYEEDKNGDGRADYRRAEGWTYDGNGNLTSRLYEEDKNGDGRADYGSSSHYTYDANGNLTSSLFETDKDGDGTIDSRTSYQYTYDANGNRLSYFYEGDSNADGTIDSRYSFQYTYDANGNRLSYFYEGDDNADGTIDSRGFRQYTYDAKGNNLSQVFEWDANGDGIIDHGGVMSYDYDYDERGNLVRQRLHVDITVGEASDYQDIHEWSYDDQGRMLSHLFIWEPYDDSGMGSRDYWQITFDGYGRQIGWVKENELGRGEIVERETEMWVYDDNGTLLERSAEWLYEFMSVYQTLTFEYRAAVDDTASTDAKSAVAIAVLANDGGGDPAAYTITAINGVAVTIGQDVAVAGGGRVTLNADQTLTFDPDGDFTGLGLGQSRAATFSYTVDIGRTDLAGNAITANASVAVTVDGLAERIGTLSFAVLSDRGKAMKDGVVDFATETLQPSHHIQHQALLAILGDGDRLGEAGETGFVLSGMGNGGRVMTLAKDNDAADPVLITAHGRINNAHWGELTKAVRFANDRGFGLDNGPDGEGAAKVLNCGDALTFDVGTAGKLGKVVFTVNAANAGKGADVKLAADGTIVSSGMKKAGGGADDFALDLGLVKHGSEVVLDLMARQLTYTAADGSVREIREDGMASLFAEFAAVGGEQITIGSLLGEGFAIQDLRLEVWSEVLLA